MAGWVTGTGSSVLRYAQVGTLDTLAGVWVRIVVRPLFTNWLLWSTRQSCPGCIALVDRQDQVTVVSGSRSGGGGGGFGHPVPPEPIGCKWRVDP